LISSHLALAAQTSQISEREESIKTLRKLLREGINLDMKQQILLYLGASSISGTVGLAIGAGTVLIGSTIPAIVLALGCISYGTYLAITEETHES
jgi:hypothetical protein